MLVRAGNVCGGIAPLGSFDQLGLWRSAHHPLLIHRRRESGLASSTPGAASRSLRSGVSSIRDARPDEVELVRSLFREYAASLNRDLSFQEFERELTELLTTTA